MFELPRGRLFKQFLNQTAAIQLAWAMDREPKVADGLLMPAADPRI
jgi:hypothetical protein